MKIHCTNQTYLVLKRGHYFELFLDTLTRSVCYECQPEINLCERMDLGECLTQIGIGIEFCNLVYIRCTVSTERDEERDLSRLI